MINMQALLEENRKLKAQLLEQDDLIRDLKGRISILETLKFGPKSEKWTPVDERQGLLFNEAEDEAFQQVGDTVQEKAVTETLEVKSYTRRKKRNQGRKPISRALPREEAEYDIPEEEKHCACGSDLECIGCEVTERVAIKPVEVKVIQEKRRKYVCRNCEGIESEKPGVITAKGKKHLLPGSMADESFLAWSISEKYEFALPYYRQAKRLEYIGVPISRATLSKQSIRAAEKCKVLYDLLKKHIQAGPVINADETPVQVLKEPGRKARDKSYMWVFLGGQPEKQAVIFQYDQTRSADVPYEFLKDFRGCLQTDDYVSYGAALKKLNTGKRFRKKIKHILCWAHARRKFHVAWKNGKSEQAKTAMAYIRELFRLEKLKEGNSLSDFMKLREEKAKEIFRDFRTWIEAVYRETLPNGDLGKACAYTLSNWDQLIRYIEHPFLTPSNNAAENAIRPFVVGRKNWLFSCTPRGAEASAILYSLIQSAKLSKLNPYEYLLYIFEKLPYATEEKDYPELLPFNLDAEKIKRG